MKRVAVQGFGHHKATGSLGNQRGLPAEIAWLQGAAMPVLNCQVSACG